MRVRATFLAVISFLVAAPVFATGDDEFFDASGRLIRSTDAEGVTSHYVYNEDGELIETRKSNGTVIIHKPGGIRAAK